MERGREVWVKRDLNFPIKEIKGKLMSLDHSAQIGRFVKSLGNGEVIVEVRDHEFVVGQDEVEAL